MKVLYQLGSRKVILLGVGQVGCIPYELARYNSTRQNHCNKNKNNIVNLFNSGLLRLIDNFDNGQLSGSKFVFLDYYKSTSNLFNKPTSHGTPCLLYTSDAADE